MKGLTTLVISMSTNLNIEQVVDLDHGMKTVYFYSKRKPNEASKIKDYQVPVTFKPLYFRSFFQIRSMNHNSIN